MINTEINKKLVGHSKNFMMKRKDSIDKSSMLALCIFIMNMHVVVSNLIFNVSVYI